jgi:hypothetical protein
MSSSSILRAKVPREVGINHQLLECRLLQDLEHISLRIIDNVLLQYVVTLRQWSTGLGFDGPTKKACPVLGLSKPMGKPIAKRGNYNRESSGS